MRVIDLLNKIANGEIPKKIIYDDRQWTYDEKLEDYITYDDSRIDWKYTIMEYINDEVEIIEEDNKIPILQNLNLTKIDINKRGQIYGVTTKEMVADIQTLQNWINKIIDYINKEDK